MLASFVGFTEAWRSNVASAVTEPEMPSTLAPPKRATIWSDAGIASLPAGTWTTRRAQPVPPVSAEP